MHSDLQLLSKYHQRGDALAFRDLMKAHASMVLATARRITRDVVMAEDVAQETFLQLARQSQQVTESVAAWLHRVAWRRACNAVRADATRRRHEEAAVAEANAAEEGAADSGEEASWSEVEAVLDAVIEELPDNLRAPLVMHFLQGRSQREIAKELRMSQSTVSRAVESGLAEVRSRLRGKGVLCGAGLGLMIAAKSASAAAVPASLMMALNKLGMSGIGGGTSIIGMTLAAKLTLGFALALLSVGGAVVVNVTSSASQIAPSLPVQVAAATPPPSPAANGAKVMAAPAAVVQVVNQLPPSVASAMPVHELVHSFPMPPQNPSGHLTRDADGWIWGTMALGGDYGQGLIYKMRADGSDWQHVFSFNGHDGGSGPLDGLLLTEDGCFWGVTNGRDNREPSTLFEFNPRTGALTTMATSTDRRLTVRPILGPDGQIWGTSNAAVYRFDRQAKTITIVLDLTGKTGAHPGTSIRAGLAADGLGYLWGTASDGGASNHGTVFKINIATRAATTVVEFTGRAGAFLGEHPQASLALDGNGYLWGTTRGTGTNRRADPEDGGSVFKIHAETGVFTHVADFVNRLGENRGKHPETILVADGQGSIWGTTSYGGLRDCGTIFKVNSLTGQVTTPVHFTSYEGAAPGKSPRGHLMADGAGGAIGVCNFGGAGFLGTIYRVDFATGKFSLLTDISDLAQTNEGAQPEGSLVAGSDGWLWGVASMNGTHHCGTVFKFDPVTNALVSVANFTGEKGPHRGRVPCSTLYNDGAGYLWGTTRSGGQTDFGTVFKVNERTGELTTVLDFKANGNNVRGGTRSELVPDGKGWLWSSTYSTWFHIQGTVYKMHMATGQIMPISTFDGDEGPRFGRGPGTLAYDGNGFMWGASMADYQRTRGSLFKIDINTNKRTTVAAFSDCGPSAGYQSMGDMHFDGKGSLWFTAVIDGGAKNAGHALVKVNTRTGEIEGRYRQTGYSDIVGPISDENGILWGTTPNGGAERRGSIYTFDPATQKFATFLSFTGNGSQANSGSQANVTRLMKHTDGNFYAVTRFGGPGGNGTVFRLRFGPTPMTQEATLLADGRSELHGTLAPNGRDSEAAFEWGTDPLLANAQTVAAGHVSAGDAAKPVAATLSGLRPATTYYFRLRGINAANKIPQRGAVLRFTTPGAEATPSDLLAEASKPRLAEQGAAVTAASTSKHALKINRIPGAGAGFVRGALTGPAYEVGKRYSLTALADNDYIFDHWSGPGISGTKAESQRLDFVFTEEMARSPVINATFVRNPFRDAAIGLFNGLVRASESVTPDVTNTGAVRISVTRMGTFTGTLRYDGDVIPLDGVFDTGGLARFGPARASSWALTRTGKASLLIAMQLDLSADGPHEVVGTIGSVSGKEVIISSIFNAARSYYDGREHVVPPPYLADDGRYLLTITGAANEDASGLMHLSAAGSAIFAARLSDGTSVLAQAPVSQAHQAAFFAQLYAKRTGSFGGTVTIGQLLPTAEPTNQPFWWSRLDQVWFDLAVRPRVER